MSVPQILFLVASVVTLGAAIAVVSSRNVLHSALLLALSFFGVAILYVLLDAPYLAAAQVLVYIGAVSILMVFAIMLSRKVAARDLVQRNGQWLVALVVAVALFGVMAYMLLQAGGLWRGQHWEWTPSAVWDRHSSGPTRCRLR